MADSKAKLSLIDKLFETQSSKFKIRNFFTLSLGSLFKSFNQSLSDNVDIKTGEIDKDIDKFCEISIKLLNDTKFIENHGNYLEKQDQISTLVESSKKINKFIMRFSKLNNEFVFTKNMIINLTNQNKEAEKSKDSLNSKAKSIEMNELCWYFWVNNFPAETQLTSKEINVLYRFLEENLDFKVTQDFKTMVEINLDNRGNFSLDVLNGFLDNFSNIALLNSFRDGDSELLLKSKNKPKDNLLGSKKLILQIVELPEYFPEISKWLNLWDTLEITNDGTVNYDNLKIKSAINPIADDKNFRIGRWAPKIPDVNFLLPPSIQTVSRKQCSIDWDQDSFGLTCLTTSNPTLFKAKDDRTFPMELNYCFQIASSVVFRVKNVSYSKNEDGRKTTKVSVNKNKQSEKNCDSKNINYVKKSIVSTLDENTGGTRRIVVRGSKPKNQEPEKIPANNENSPAPIEQNFNNDEIAKITIELLKFYTVYEKNQKLEYTFVVKMDHSSKITYYETSDPDKKLDFITIGRGKDQSISIIDNNETRDVSRSHCIILFDPELKFSLKPAKTDCDCFMMLKTYNQYQDDKKIDPSDRFLLEKGMKIALEGVVLEVNEIQEMVVKKGASANNKI